MADDKDEGHVKNPETIQSDNSTEKAAYSSDKESRNQNPESENMEVHHHSHHEGKKGWRSYFWEFLMLFLAVFCGFLAEWQLEHTIEHSREKEFIASMIEDAQLDTANIHTVLEQNQNHLVYIDSLTAACFNYESEKSSDLDIYRYYRHILAITERLKPTERTLTQLMNSGGMRLIRKKLAADRIIMYSGSGKDVVSQQTLLDMAFMNMLTSGYELFNFNSFKSDNYVGIAKNSVLLSHDRNKLIQFANRVTSYGAGTAVFCSQLEKMNKEAILLIEALRKEYHMSN